MVLEFDSWRGCMGRALTEDELEEWRIIEQIETGCDYEGYIPLADEEMDGYQIIYDNE